jgi:uncharacterized membrane protein YjjB (DUF3815 family)
MCATGAFMIAAGAAQWSPILTASMGMPPLAFIYAAKPTVGFALFLNSTRRAQAYAIIGGCIFVTVSLAMAPHWPVDWLTSLHTAIQVAPPILRFGGIAVLAVALRWRRPEARLILALACVPQTGSWYEVLPLFLVPATRREMMILASVSSLGWILQDFVMTARNEAEFNAQVGSLMVAFAYLPAVLMVLRRPNKCDAHAWL